MIMIEIQCRGTALLLLVSPHIPHQNNGIMHPSYINYHLKRICFVASYVCSTYYIAAIVLKRITAIQVAIMKMWTISINVSTTKSTPFAVSKDKWGTKKGTSKNTLYAQWYGKRHLMKLNSVKVKPIVLATVEFRESEGIIHIRQAIS